MLGAARCSRPSPALLRGLGHLWELLALPPPRCQPAPPHAAGQHSAPPAGGARWPGVVSVGRGAGGVGESRAHWLGSCFRLEGPPTSPLGAASPLPTRLDILGKRLKKKNATPRLQAPGRPLGTHPSSWLAPALLSPGSSPSSRLLQVPAGFGANATLMGILLATPSGGMSAKWQGNVPADQSEMVREQEGRWQVTVGRRKLQGLRETHLGTGPLSDALHHRERTSVLQRFAKRLPHSRHRCTEDNQASTVPDPTRCPGCQRHSEEALITQTVKGTKQLKINNNNI